MSDSAIVYIGTYTRKMGHVDGKAGGIEVCRLNRASGTLDRLATVPGVENPSFLMLSADGRFLYAVQELGQWEGRPGGAVSAFAVEPGGGLALINHQPTHGADPCYVSVDQTGRWLLAANYSGGSVTVLPILADGSLGPATQVVQHAGASAHHDGPHPHAAVPVPGGDVVLAPDCGLNKVFVYRLDAAQGRLAQHGPPAELPPASGPRHLALHPSGRAVYCVNEHGSSVTAFAYDAARGALDELATLPALPAGFAGRNAGADIHVRGDGRFVYASMRGHDSIAVFAVDQESWRLAPEGHAPTLGRTPRNFALDPASDLLLAANQDTSTVALFRVDPHSGMPAPTGHVAEVPTPVCVRVSVGT